MNLSSYREYQRESRGENLRGQRRPIGLLGAKRRLLAISILVLGLTTFFIPLISTDPAVMGTGSWSLWNVVAAVQNGTLTNPPNLNFIVIPGSIYVLMAVDLLGLCFSTLFSVSKVQATISLIGAWLCLVARYSHLGQKNWELDRFFYGRIPIGHANSGLLTTWLLVVTSTLFLVCLDATLDTDESPTSQRQSGQFRDAPGVLDAEILQQNDEVPQTHRDPRRLHD